MIHILGLLLENYKITFLGAYKSERSLKTSKQRNAIATKTFSYLLLQVIIKDPTNYLQISVFICL